MTDSNLTTGQESDPVVTCLAEAEQREAGRTIEPARFREAREFIGFTVAGVARAIGCVPADLERIEAGGTKVTGLQLRRLSRLYRRPVAWFFDEYEWEPPADILAELDRVNATDHDRQVVLDFAEWLQGAGRPAPKITGPQTENRNA